MNKILSSSPYQQSLTLATVRVAIGIFMAYHGWEVFNSVKMQEYSKWMVDLNFIYPSMAAYAGKGSELVGGILLALGLCTRFASLLLTLTMAVVSFGIGHGRILMEDQHPFLFVVFGLMFLFLGAGDFSVDKKLFSKQDIKNKT